MERVVAPQHRDVGGLGAGLQRAVEPAEPVGHELLAAHRDVLKPARAGVAHEVAGVNAWMSTSRSSAWSCSSPASPSAAAGRGAAPQHRAPGGASATAPRLGGARCDRRTARARRRTRSARRARARGETRRTPRCRSGRWWSTAWPSTRSKLPSANGSDSASARAVRTSRPRRCGIGRERAEHAGRDVGAGRLADHAGLQQVQAEVARAGADLERPAEAAVELRPSSLRSLPSTCPWPMSPKSMPHLES